MYYLIVKSLTKNINLIDFSIGFLKYSHSPEEGSLSTGVEAIEGLVHRTIRMPVRGFCIAKLLTWYTKSNHGYMNLHMYIPQLTDSTPQIGEWSSLHKRLLLTISMYEHETEH